MGQQRESSSSSSSSRRRRRRRRRDSSRGARRQSQVVGFLQRQLQDSTTTTTTSGWQHMRHTQHPVSQPPLPPALLLYTPPHPRLDTQLDGSLAGPHSTSASFERNEIIMRFLRSLFPPRQQGRRGEVERGWVRGCRDCWDCHGWAPNERMKERNDKNS